MERVPWAKGVSRSQARFPLGPRAAIIRSMAFAVGLSRVPVDRSFRPPRTVGSLSHQMARSARFHGLMLHSLGWYSTAATRRGIRRDRSARGTGLPVWWKGERPWGNRTHEDRSHSGSLPRRPLFGSREPWSPVVPGLEGRGHAAHHVTVTVSSPPSE